jgi:hypothetical protein
LSAQVAAAAEATVVVAEATAVAAEVTVVVAEATAAAVEVTVVADMAAAADTLVVADMDLALGIPVTVVVDTHLVAADMDLVLDIPVTVVAVDTVPADTVENIAVTDTADIGVTPVGMMVDLALVGAWAGLGTGTFTLSGGMTA